MPTGYTADVQSGKVTDFRTFALQCARAFGALITMRDDPADATIPDEFQPGTHNSNALKQATERLAALSAMSPAQAEAAAQQDFKERTSAKRKYEADKEAQRARYDAMIDHVMAWTPPTPDHLEMKSFMLQQLLDSKRIDCGGEYWQTVEPLSGEQWLAAQRMSTQRDIDYYADADRKERERAADRTAWVRALKASLT